MCPLHHELYFYVQSLKKSSTFYCFVSILSIVFVQVMSANPHSINAQAVTKLEIECHTYIYSSFHPYRKLTEALKACRNTAL